MERVLGIGGYFLRAVDPVALGAWYRDCLGLDADENGGWRQEAGVTVFATFESETEYFGSRLSVRSAGTIITAEPPLPMAVPRARRATGAARVGRVQSWFYPLMRAMAGRT